jgi:hypothetical protein
MTGRNRILVSARPDEDPAHARCAGSTLLWRILFNDLDWLILSHRTRGPAYVGTTAPRQVSTRSQTSEKATHISCRMAIGERITATMRPQRARSLSRSDYLFSPIGLPCGFGLMAGPLFHNRSGARSGAVTPSAAISSGTPCSVARDAAAHPIP